MSERDRFRLERSRAALLVVDVQERLAAAMPKEEYAQALANMVRWVEGAKVLGVPILWTEQYVKGLGPTVPELTAAIGTRARPAEKLLFSCLVEPILEGLAGKTQVVCVGMETHVCVFQTVRDLAERGTVPFVPQDAVISRTRANWQAGLDLARQVGATITSTEAGLFDLTQRAGTDEFRSISKLVK
ncbi:MAG: isochorismatase family protein [Myxococcales bacterium]